MATGSANGDYYSRSGSSNVGFMHRSWASFNSKINVGQASQDFTALERKVRNP